jgi:flagellar hook-length control protein FliK
MPVALSNSPASTVAAAGTAASGASGGAPSPASGADFLLVLAQQICTGSNAAHAAPAATAQPATNTTLPASFMELFSPEIPESTSQDSDTDSEDSDDTEDAVDFAALLPGLCAAPPAHVPVNNAAPTRPETAPVAVITSQGEAADTAADALIEATADPNAADSDAATAPSTTAPQAAHAAQAHAGLTNHLASSPDASQMARELRAPVGTPAWNDELGGQLTWMAANGRESASLRLSPENLGPLEIRISVEDGEAKVWFGASQADTRAALESSLPRLRELLASQGLVLADAGVFRDAPRGHASASEFAAQPDGDGDSQSVSAVTIAHNGLIDTYV